MIWRTIKKPIAKSESMYTNISYQITKLRGKNITDKTADRNLTKDKPGSLKVKYSSFLSRAHEAQKIERE